MKKLNREKNYRTNKKLTLFSFSLVFILIILFISQFFIANQLVESGEKIKEISQKAEILAYENQELNQRIAGITSLEVINEKARKELGMVELTSVIYLSNPMPIALNQ